MRVVMVLGDSVLAWRLKAALKWAIRAESLLESYVVHFNADDLAYVDAQDVTETISRIRPAVVINCVETEDIGAASSPKGLDGALGLNAHAPGLLALVSRGIDAFFIHLSTEFVFGAGAIGPYQSSQRPAPLQTYGQSRWWGELVVHSVSQKGRYLIVRVPQMYGQGMSGQADLAKEAAKGIGRATKGNFFRPALWSNCLTTPAYVDHVATVLANHVVGWDLMDRVFTGTSRLSHVVHCAPFEEPTSWYALFKEEYPISAGQAPPKPAMPGIGGLVPSLGWELPSYAEGLAAFKREWASVR